MTAQWQNSRKVLERVVVKGTLELTSPAHFSSGESGALTDIPILRDPTDGSPLLTGASIAGALRNYLREYTLGFGMPENKDGKSLAEKLFGFIHDAEDASYESWLFVEDARGTPPSGGKATELRDGVTIDSASRTAEIDEHGKGKKYDIELLSAGTHFDLGFELWLPVDQYEELLEAFTIALEGLKQGHIHLGMRKRRGYGECNVDTWEVSRYRMDNPAEVIAWLNQNDQPGILPSPTLIHKGEAFTIDATFRLEDSSLLIRSNSGEGDAPDMLHIRSWRGGSQKPILSGTSLAGALRSRSLRIANTLMGNKEYGSAFVDKIYGKRIQNSDDIPSGSLVSVAETVIEPGTAIIDRIQNRVKIDRFTGGAFPGALFSQQPIFGKDNGATKIHIRLSLQKTPANEGLFDAQVGLLLLVLKDLWTGDLPIGGESSVGRGRLQGEHARLELGNTFWELTVRPDGSIAFGGNEEAGKLESQFLNALKEACHG